MANKQIIHSYEGMIQDTSKSKFPNQFYFEGKNIRIIATDTQSTGSLTNEKGNSLIFKIPTPVINYSTKIITYDSVYFGIKTLPYSTSEINYSPAQSGDQVIIGHANTRTYLILFTTDDNGFDCVWKMRYDNYDISLLYLRDMDFSKNNPIQAISNFENKIIDKIYWVDGNSQLKFLNIEHSIANKYLEELIDVPLSVVDMVGKYKLTQPIISSVSAGGTHTAGMIQYAYNLYRVNSSQTKISPLSEMIPLDKGTLGGGALNEIVGSIPSVTISDIDTSYTNIRTYAIKYTSYNESPSISIIDDREIPSSKTINIYDDGSVISTVSLEEFLFLGSDIIIPKHIVSKFNRLFLANYEEVNFSVDIDCRAYSFNNAGTSIIYENLSLVNGIPTGTPLTVDTSTVGNEYKNVPLTHDAVNLYYDIYKFQKSSSTKLGGEGRNIKYELTKSTTLNKDNKYFKDDEVYRIGIEFFNVYGQFSLPNWIADFRAPSGNLEGSYNTLSVTLKTEFFTELNSMTLNEYEKPIGYKIVIAERTINDRTIIANGLINSVIIDEKSSVGVQAYDAIKTQSDSLLKLTGLFQRNCNETSDYGKIRPIRRAKHLEQLKWWYKSANNEVQNAGEGKDIGATPYQYSTMFQLYSPEILFGGTIPLSGGLKLRVKGSLKNHTNNSWLRKVDTGVAYYNLFAEGKAINGVSPYYSSSSETITGDVFSAVNNGLICHSYDSNPRSATHAMFYRGYGYISNTSQSTSTTFSFTKDLVDTGTSPDVDNLVFFSDGQKSINGSLDMVDYSQSLVSYTITPSVGYTTVPYDVSICYDIEGNNPIIGTELSGVIGTQTVTRAETTAGSYKYFLKITSSVEFSGNVTAFMSLGPDPSATLIKRTTTTNPFTVGVVDPIISSYYDPAPNKILVDIYGTPEVTEKGQDSTLYNNDSKFRYTNSLKSFYTDGDSHFKDVGTFARKIVSINSFGNRCITLVAGSDNISTNSWDRPKLEELFLNAGLTGDDNGLLVELVKSDTEIYLGNIYGGNSYEDKTRSNYIEIGDYKEINQLSPTIYIDSPGDTFIENFKFARIVKTDTEIISQGTYQLEEIVEFTTETAIDLKNRNDLSLNVWDSKFSPSDSEFHKYNKVYSQNPTLIKRRNLNYTTKKLASYDTNIVATKLKSSGEIIDNWTDVQLNEVMTLDGKYGSINNITSFNDEVYSFQDRALAYISISPRVQTQGSDGLAIQLGTGNVLDKYKYITTSSGCVNKWSIVSTPKGIYYFDLINKAYVTYRGGLSDLSSDKDMHTYFMNNINANSLVLDNPLIKTGISSGYDYLNNDVFMTFHQTGNPSFTLSYNEKRDRFVSFYDYIPSMYMSRGDSFITTSPDVKSVYRQYAGNYNTFYGVYYPSSITFNVNPEATQDCVFDNINFKSEVYLNNVDVVDKTITNIKAYNDYQDSTLVPLVLGRNNNLRRKFRDWNALIPRDGRNRIRAPFIKLKLDFNQPSNNYKFVLHDVAVYYTV